MMATYYVWSEATGLNDGTSWENAYILYSSAVAAATLETDIIKIHYTHKMMPGDTVSYIYVNPAVGMTVCVDKDDNDSLRPMMYDGHFGNINSSIKLYVQMGSSVNRAFMHGITFRIAGIGTNIGVLLFFSTTTAKELRMEECLFWISGTGYKNGVVLGSASGGTSPRQTLILSKCIFHFNTTAQGIRPGVAKAYFSYCRFIGESPEFLFTNCVETTTYQPDEIICDACDFSELSETTLVGNFEKGHPEIRFTNCKFGNNTTVYSPYNKNSTLTKEPEVIVYNCYSDIKKYRMEHHTVIGSTISVGEDDIDAVFARDAACCESGIRASWKITTRSGVNIFFPYRTPWFDVYNNNITDLMSLSIQILRIGSNKPFNDDEVWVEMLVPNGNGPLSTLYSDMLPLSGQSNNIQPEGIGVDKWIGVQGEAWSGKLNLYVGVTAGAAGFIRVRVNVAIPSVTLYVDPQLRGIPGWP